AQDLVATARSRRQDIHPGRGQVWRHPAVRPVARWRGELAGVDQTTTGGAGDVVVDVAGAHADSLVDVARATVAAVAAVADGGDHEHAGVEQVAHGIDHLVHHTACLWAQGQVDDVRAPPGRGTGVV